MSVPATTLSRRATLAGAAAVLLRAARAQAADPPSDLLARIAQARTGVQTLQGPFVQTRSIGLLSTAVRSTGALALVRPDRMRWDLAPPDDVSFWIGPEGLAYRSAHGQGQVATVTARMAGALDDLRTLLGGDLGRLRDRWDLRVVRDDATGAELEGAPRAGSVAGLRGLTLALGPDLVRPTRAILVEGPRDRTVIEFGTMAVNTPIEVDRMRPPPPGK